VQAEDADQVVLTKVEDVLAGVRRLIELLALTATLAACGSTTDRTSAHGTPVATSTPQSQVVLRADCGTPEARPKQIILTCADAGIYLDKLSWSDWGKRVATASGVIDVHGCDPDCVDDNRNYTYGVTVTAHEPVTCDDGSRQYAFIRIRVTSGPDGKNRPQDEDVGYDCPS
jgi:hypothetical protein